MVFGETPEEQDNIDKKVEDPFVDEEDDEKSDEEALKINLDQPKEKE